MKHKIVNKDRQTDSCNGSSLYGYAIVDTLGCRYVVADKRLYVPTQVLPDSYTVNQNDRQQFKQITG